ncbi:MAG: type I glyceraldehyde-3-phosphate dehydrogenase [Lentisphaeria bacterium]|jgi:glyceraldehyde 3-phosphate dehydrogenase|nr:type I glyceraldehyde-3-phosphate dehydrogenase [Lentisphaeria bacterium]
MTIKIGINGFGRIGRNVFRVIKQTGADVEVVAINDLVKPAALAHLLKYDSVMGRYPGKVEATETGIVVDGKPIIVSAEKDPANIKWAAAGVEIVLESTGFFRDRAGIEKHFVGGAKKVLLSVPSKKPEDVDATIVYGVNHTTLKAEHKIVSNASCTTNCLAPLAKVLHEAFGIKHGLMTTIHSYTNDQKVIDAPHEDPRRSRSAAVNMIPTSTGAAKAVGLVIPELNGKLNGTSVRVPTQCGSLVDFVAVLNKDVTKEEVNAAMKAAAEKCVCEGGLAGVLEYCTDPIVLTDILGDSNTSIFDSLETMVIGKNMVKVVSWYDNEFGYSSKCVDLIKMMAK